MSTPHRLRLRGGRTRITILLAAIAVATQAAPKVPDGCVAAADAKAGPHGYADSIVHVKTGIELALIPAGRFTMGLDEFAIPLHEVVIESPFYISTTEITNAVYRKFVEAASYDGAGDTDPAYDLYLRHWRGESLMSKADTFPVVWVSWHNATAFCKWAGLQLPAEAQWEYACRAGTTTHYSFGDERGAFAQYGWAHGWTDADSQALTNPVARKRPNAWGLYDMHGNVWEWGADDFVVSYEGAPTDGSARIEEKLTKVLRGGSWSNNTRFWIAGSGARFNSAPGNASNNIGFRVVLPLE